MIALVLMLVLSGPQPLKRCASACIERGSVLVCSYDLSRSCRPWEVECVDRPGIACVPRSVDLGSWDPVPADYVPASVSDFPAGSLSVPPDWGEFPTEKPPP